ncbi:hypothetical protein [Pseudochrobactrum sp. AO18b]|uniref:hypothetical protein n=1 Tax=Pseudochrobactrum sp. AO18b TaxID=1201036 RepID=UPI0003B5E1FE|nr:hypothetical protein [Pseudochrobactrum sp. AO18b]
MPNAPVPAAAEGLPAYKTACEIHDNIFLALDIAENQCPPREETCELMHEACELMRDALSQTKQLLEKLS